MSDELTAEEQQIVANAAEMRIGKLDLAAGDILVVQFEDAAVMQARASVYCRVLQDMVPKGVRVIAIGPEANFSIIREKDQDGR